MNSNRIIKIATRASQLALWQARHVAALIQELDPELEVELVHVTTMGDRQQTGPLTALGGDGVFTREVQHTVLSHQADLAVHSLKDLPTQPVTGLCLAAVPVRGAVGDGLILPLHQHAELQQLPPSAKIGTSSPRRKAQLLYARPDLQIVEIRGNVDTRLKKLDAGDFDAIILACAGLIRLDLQARISQVLAPPVLFPAVGQGALGIECRCDDAELIQLLSQLNDSSTRLRILAERSLLAFLRAGCHAPLGVTTEFMSHPQGNSPLQLEAVVLSLDGRERVHASGLQIIPELTDPASEEIAVKLGQDVGLALLELGAGKLIQV